MTPIIPSAHAPSPGGRRSHRPYRVPLGLPKGRDDWRMGSVVSAVVHLAIIALLLTPLGMLADISEIEQGAGGPGPAGGGGGGNRGTGRFRAEVLKFVRVAPAMPTPTPAVTPPPKPPPPEVVPPTPLPQIAVLKEPEPTMTVGIGGGTGTDQTTGTGPGSGGGVGTGIGTGRGSATGPGTGGGTQANYPPTAIEMFIPPLPTPPSVKGFRLVAEFDVDESGKVLAMTFTETKDRGYNRRIAEVLRGYRFRPGTRPDGTPIRMKAQIFIELP
jgi:protein TonB